jgi:hypothetical protein
MERVEIGAILLPEDLPFSVDGEEPRVLGPLSKVNVFVGPNNSGKSRLLRWMFAGWDGQVRLSAGLQEAWANANSRLRDSIALWAPPSVPRAAQATQSPILLTLAGDPRLFSDLLVGWRELLAIADEGHVPTRRVKSSELLLPMGRSTTAWVAGAESLAKLPMASMKDTKRAYIPILRSLRRHGDGDTLATRVRADHGWQKLGQPGALQLPGTSGGLEPASIFTGQGLYERLQAMLLGTLAQRQAVQKYERFLGDTFFQGKSVSLVPRMGQDHLFVKVGDEQEFAIHDLGDGVQAVILLTFLPYTVQEPTLFFIEEPELHAHPGLQRILLDAMTATTGKLAHHTFFLTTHSNHLLELTADHGNISIFRLDKDLDGEGDEKTAKVTVTALKAGDRGMLESLGVRAASVFLVNATLWVEGITDRWFFGVLLAALREKLKAEGEKKGSVLRRLDEDLHWAFVEYAGGNITHWSFLDEEGGINVDTLCSRLMLVVDQDGGKKVKRHEKLLEALGDRLIVLPRRELENLVPPSVWNAVVLGSEKRARTAEEDGELSELVFEPKWADYASEPIGKYIETTVEPEAKVKWAADSGTLSRKVDRWRDGLIPELRKLKFQEFPVEVRDLAERMHRFLLKEVYGNEEPYV